MLDNVPDFLGFLALAAFLAIALMLYLRWERNREAQLKAFAKSQGILLNEEASDLLPQPLRDLLPNGLETRYGLSGRRHGEEVLLFEFARGWGRNRRWMSVLAVQQHHARTPSRSLPAGYHFARSGDWTMLYPFGFFSRRLRLATVAEWWDELRTATPEEARQFAQRTQANTDVLIRPRHERP